MFNVKMYLFLLYNIWICIKTVRHHKISRTFKVSCIDFEFFFFFWPQCYQNCITWPSYVLYFFHSFIAVIFSFLKLSKLCLSTSRWRLLLMIPHCNPVRLCLNQEKQKNHPLLFAGTSALSYTLRTLIELIVIGPQFVTYMTQATVNEFCILFLFASVILPTNARLGKSANIGLKVT